MYQVKTSAKDGSISADLLTTSSRLEFPVSSGTATAAAKYDQENQPVVQNEANDQSNGGAAKPAASLPKTMRMYQDEMLTSFVRRLAFSPDSALLIAPCGVVTDKRIGAVPEKSDQNNHVAWVYLRGALTLYISFLHHVPFEDDGV